VFGFLALAVFLLGFFIGAFFGIPVQFIAVVGAVFLLGYYAIREPHGVWPILRSAPWYILVFAFGMYTLVYGLHKEGLTGVLGRFVEFCAGNHLLGMILVTGILLTILSCFMNNLPSVMIGTIMLQDLHLTPHTLQLSFPLPGGTI
jgi:arsenical pump membrane protein